MVRKLQSAGALRAYLNCAPCLIRPSHLAAALVFVNVLAAYFEESRFALSLPVVTLLVTDQLPKDSTRTIFRQESPSPRNQLVAIREIPYPARIEMIGIAG